MQSAVYFSVLGSILQKKMLELNTNVYKYISKCCNKMLAAVLTRLRLSDHIPPSKNDLFCF